MDVTLVETIDLVEEQYRRVFVKQLRTLLTEDGAYLSFVGGMAAIDALACFYGGAERDAKGNFRNEAMFKQFVTDLFPQRYGQGFNLWDLRNSLVHRFVVHQGFILKFADPTAHTKRHGPNIVGLDAENFLADLAAATDAYFTRLRNEPAL